ncbi:YggT family protein [Thermicanus aegyptius]|uniref:YggT family protein n=1 Tax=Thermicanus aegyptius TaxID=94009 RepID=UPI00040EB962|nr:YggT family protein [Thermicanus aegyptius]MBE3553484.1 YggT family protein [Thermicanus sp.]
MAAVILTIAQYLFEAYLFAIIFWILSSWIPPLRDSAIGQWVGNLVEPYLSLFRFIPPIGMIDISPIFAILLYQYIIYPFGYQGLATILSWILP